MYVPQKYLHSIVHVKQFHEAFGHPIAAEPGVGDQKLRRLRVMLIAEELTELAVALGVPFSASVSEGKDGKLVAATTYADAADCASDDEVDLVEAADALGDIDYVTQGANLVFGLPAGEIMDEIQSSNMSKLGADGNPIYNADGKVVKGPNYRKPDIARVLKDYDAHLKGYTEAF